MSFSSENPSRILLLCFHQKPNTAPSPLEIDHLKTLLGPIGNLQKIMIFSPFPSFKAFVEFGDLSSSSLAQSFIHNSTVDHFGLVSAFFSKRSEIRCMGKQKGYWEITDLAKNTNSVSTDLEISSSNKSHVVRPVSDKHPIVTSMTSIRPSDSSSEVGSGQARPRSEFIGTNPSRVVLVSNLGDIFKSVRQIFNVFKSFGFIRKILYMRNQSKSLIEFNDEESSQRAIYHLNTKWLSSTMLKVSYSRFTQIDLRPSSDVNQLKMTNDSYDSSKSVYSGHDNNLEYNTPSNKLGISFMRHTCTDLVEIIFFIDQEIKVISPLAFKELRHEISPVLIDVRYTLPSINDAYMVMKRLHNHNIYSSVLQVNFL